MALLTLVSLAFIAAGLLFIPRLGIEVDEALIASGIYAHGSPQYSLHFGQRELPLMLLTYLGALKTWMYNLIFLVLPPRPMSLRLPTLLLGAATLWMFFALLSRTVGRRAAWTGTILLACDTAYVLMNTVDYGPVTLQFVLKLWAILLLIRFHQAGSRLALAAAFFLLGLALWDKAVFGWVLFGLAAATAAVFPRELRRHLTFANLRVAIPLLLLGALPLIVYNIAHPFETLRANAAVEQTGLANKLLILPRTLDGYVFFGFITDIVPGPQPSQPSHFHQSLSIAINDALRAPYHSLTVWALAATVLALPLLWRTPVRRPVLFGLAACLATWIPMAATAGAGAAAQHVILLWPFHFLAIAAALSQIPLRAAAAVTAVLCASSLAVTNHYYADLLRFGPTLRWTDAMDRLHYELRETRAANPAARFYAADWGIFETMNLLSEGELPMFGASGETEWARAVTDPRSIFVAHPQDVAIHPEERASLEAAAHRLGYSRATLITIHDRNGRPAFDVFRFRKIHL